MNYADKIKKYRKIEEKSVTCWAPFQAMHINKKGRIKPCPFSMQPKNKADITKQISWLDKKSLKDCWDDFVYEEMRAYSLEGSLHPEWCEYCAKQCIQGKPPSSLDYDYVGGRRDIDHEYPKELELELSNKCNYMCEACGPWCSSEWQKKIGLNGKYFESIFDDTSIKNKFIEDLRDIIHHVHRINFTGGEPFAQRVVYDILKMIEDEDPKDLIIHFTTNGSVMNEAVKRIVKRKNTRFTVSLDSINPKTYPLIRVNGNYDNVMKNINYMIENSDNTVGASFVLTKRNIMELPDMISWCNDKDILFSYHILENMGYRDWEKDLKPISIEHASDEYIENLKVYLIEKISYIDTDKKNKISVKNFDMYYQYISRLKRKNFT